MRSSDIHRNRLVSAPVGDGHRHSTRTRRHRLRQQGGFSLIEVLIAMVVTVVGLLGLMSMHTTSVRSNRSSSDLVMATAIAQQTMEEVRTLPFVSPTPTARSITSVFGATPINVALTPVLGQADKPFQRQLTIEPVLAVSPDLLRIRVVVSWTEDGAPIATADPRLRHQFALETIRTRQEIL